VSKLIGRLSGVLMFASPPLLGPQNKPTLLLPSTKTTERTPVSMCIDKKVAAVAGKFRV
jgi:hypothetical protein